VQPSTTVESTQLNPNPHPFSHPCLPPLPPPPPTQPALTSLRTAAGPPLPAAMPTPPRYRIFAAARPARPSCRPPPAPATPTSLRGAPPSLLRAGCAPPLLCTAATSRRAPSSPEKKCLQYFNFSIFNISCFEFQHPAVQFQHFDRQMLNVFKKNVEFILLRC